MSAAGVAGSMVGGAAAGALERRFGAGRVLATGWAFAGFCTAALGASTWLPLTAALEAMAALCLTAGGVAMGAVTVLMVPGDCRGRVTGISTALGVVAIPVSSLLGGWLADMVGATTMFAVGGIWTVAVAILAAANPHVRAARI